VLLLLKPNRVMKSGFLPAICLVASFMGIALTAPAQIIATFEEFGLKPGEHRNNAAPAKGWQSAAIELPNAYFPDFDYWEGWALSADTNTTTPGFLNQYSVRFGKGANASTTYAVGYVYNPAIIRNTGDALNRPMTGFYVTNTTYTYLSMRDGDAFAKKFGGETGNDPDFFKLTIKKFHQGVFGPDSITVYLADYRFTDNAKDYILGEWQYVDLSVLGRVDSLQLSLSSSDNGAFGMNTPAYMAIDNVGNDILLSASALKSNVMVVTTFPNPVTDQLYLELQSPGSVSVIDLQGRAYYHAALLAGNHRIDASSWPSGIYLVTVEGRIAAKIAVE
jgi:hypothetical protein